MKQGMRTAISLSVILVEESKFILFYQGVAGICGGWDYQAVISGLVCHLWLGCPLMPPPSPPPPTSPIYGFLRQGLTLLLLSSLNVGDYLSKVRSFGPALLGAGSTSQAAEATGLYDKRASILSLICTDELGEGKKILITHL